MISDKFDPAFEHLREEKVQVTYEGRTCVGHLWFAGINSLHGQYQVTLNRTPLWPVDPTTIKPFIVKPRIHEN
jgi:hypothetical protein